MRRRAFISLLGGAAAAWPAVAHAQKTMPVIGFMSSTSAAPFAHLVAAFRDSLKDTGFVEGQNVAIEFRWADGQYDRLQMIAVELVRREVAVIVATGGTPAVLPAMAATITIPIVFITGGDPIKFSLVRSLNRPGGNVTGVNIFIAEMEAKRLGLLRDLVSTAALVGVLLNPNNPNFDNQSHAVQEAARAIGQKIQIVHAGTEASLGTALRSLVQLGTEGLLVGGDPFFNSRRNLLVALAARHGIPAIYDQREYALAGGLMSYGTSLTEAYRQVGIYTGRILKGEKPADLPVAQSTKFEFVINLNAAKALGLDVPPTLSARADEVIE
jgi:putative tryptophan/tyrosine transport system substrate-binding protein